MTRPRPIRQRLLSVALATAMLGGSMAGAMAERPTYAECMHRGLIDNNMWVFGALGYLLVREGCLITAQP